ncbi:MAG TPA: hypothetical protein VL326_13475 [Kofleriaceae bacterium]|jgi:hypothetical protein|nr:hypothetical protein [Kofleriaceae bacterium]
MQNEQLLYDRAARVIGSILIVFLTIAVTMVLTTKPENPSDHASCSAAEDALADAYLRMRTICNGRGDSSSLSDFK